MAIAALFQIPKMSEAQYRQVLKTLEAKGLGAPDGRRYHVACPDGKGWTVVDVWESEAKLGKFAETLVPALVAAGVEPPKPQVFPVANVILGR